MWQKIAILVVSLQAALISSQEIISCQYAQAGASYTCTLTIDNPEGQDFESIPGQHLPGLDNEDVTDVVANFQNTANIPGVICRQFPNLVTLSLGSNEIQTLDENSFAGCAQLSSLTLVYNNINSIPDNVFASNGRLATLNIARNNIEDISPDAFTGSALSTIDLSFNQVNILSQNVFCTVSETLTNLILMSNSLAALPENAFGCLTELQNLQLSGNENINIPGSAFQALQNLRVINLINCGLSEINPEWFTNMRSLTEVHLETNSIAELPDRVFANSRRLTNVFLSANNLTEITASPFGNNLPALEILTLVGNSIRGIEQAFFEAAENLRSLFLAGNACSNTNHEYTFDDRASVRQQLERCFRGFGPDFIGCNYEVLGETDVYGCHMTVRNPFGNEFDSIDSDHQEGQSDDDVLLVDIVNGNTGNIPQVICQQFPQLRQFLVLNSYVETINPQAFAACANLVQLHLGGNLIMEVPDETFSRSPLLQELYLGSNLIEIIQPDAFVGTAIELLDLSNNFFGMTNNAWFQPIRSTLRILDMVSVRSGSCCFDPESFVGLDELRALHISSNILSEMDGATFLPLINLEELSMSSSSIVDLNPQWFSTLSKLRRLYIARNEISNFPTNIFDPLTSLEEFIFYDNRIVEISGQSFGRSLASINLIHGSGNLINTFDPNLFEVATELDNLWLDNNLCTDIVHNNIRGDLELTRQMLSNCSNNFMAEPELSCEYDRFETGRVYWCELTAVNPLGRDDFETVAGEHLPGSNDDAVIFVQVEDQNTRIVPSVLCRQFESMQILDLINSGISEITFDSFQGCDFLRELTIMENRIRSIPAEAFAGAANHLHVLVLTNNAIEDLSVYAFAGTEIRELDLSNNRIGRYDPYTYSHIGDSLTVLRLTNNQIQSLPSNAFDNLPNLVDLELNNNQLVTIPHNAFIGNTNLQILQVANNLLERLEPGVFAPLVNLTDLELSVNRLSVLPENIFDLPNLQTLGLVQNEFRSLDSAAFGRSLSSLIFIDASINKINAFDPQIVGEESSLNDLELSFNECVDQNFQDIPDFRTEVIESLQNCINNYEAASLSCEYSEIEMETYVCFLTIDNPSDRLRFASIAGEHLDDYDNEDVVDVIASDQTSRSIPSIFCQTFTNLQTLQIAGSNVEVLSPESLEGCNSLFTLNLANNRIIDIPDGILRNTPELGILNLAGNRISTLTPMSFEGAQLVAIDLELNNLASFNPAWFEPVAPQLIWLFLHSNQISRFPSNAFSSFSSLFVLGLSGNNGTFIPSNAFNGLSNILTLYLANVGMRSLNHRWFDDLNGLNHLELDDNQLTELPDGIFDLPVLETLGLTNNQLSVLESASFGEHVGIMRTIFAENNLIDAIERRFIDNATELDMLMLIGNVCVDADFMDISVGGNREEMLAELQQCFENYENRARAY